MPLEPSDITLLSAPRLAELAGLAELAELAELAADTLPSRVPTGASALVRPQPVAADEPDPPHQECIEGLLSCTRLKAVNVLV